MTDLEMVKHKIDNVAGEIAKLSPYEHFQCIRYFLERLKDVNKKSLLDAREIIKQILVSDGTPEDDAIELDDW